jgi:hypothetical protein
MPQFDEQIAISHHRPRAERLAAFNHRLVRRLLGCISFGFCFRGRTAAPGISGDCLWV